MERREGAVGRGGQSTVEYMLVLLAVLLAVIAGVNTILKPKVESRMNEVGVGLDTAGNKLANSLK